MSVVTTESSALAAASGGEPHPATGAAHVSALLSLAGVVVLTLGLAASPLAAQGPSAGWRTLTTARFRVHYPAASEAWSRRAAGRLEEAWDRVTAEVGYRPEGKIDVVISDPVAHPNGSAWPVLGWPRLVLWTSPPGPESALGHYRDWTEELIIHEQTHLAHLLRPSRNRWRRRLEHLVPLGPLARSSPRWVTEGYATLVEGRLTGSGRPYGDLRAAVLRRWAQAGRLPSYGALASGNRTWLGLSMAYLVGSAYLEWLEEQSGPGSLGRLWARMSARRARSFEEAFAGVFGDRPDVLYGRFVAEVTWKAIELEHRLAPERRQGDLWQDLTWTTGDPALSPDGGRIALVRRFREAPTELVVWSTGPNEEAEREWRDRLEKLLERDREDVPPVRTRPLPREPLHLLTAADGAAPTTPRWAPDGASILFVRFEPDGEGFLHPDLYRWWLPPDGHRRGGRLERLTREADVRQPDPAPDGTWAVAVRDRNGTSQLVRVDLADGTVSPLTPASLTTVYDSPRISPDGRRLAYVRHRDGRWELAVRDLENGNETIFRPTRDDTVASPAWGPEGRRIYAVLGRDGLIDLYAYDAANAAAPPRRITVSPGGAFAPAPTPDGRGLFYLGLEPDGLDLRRLELAEETGRPVAVSPLASDLTPLAPVVPPVPAVAARTPPAAPEPPPGHPYGAGRQELLPLIGGALSPSGHGLELGVRSGDVIGRLDALAVISDGTGTAGRGAALAAVWRGLPTVLRLHLFSLRETPSEADSRIAAGRSLDLEQTGVELEAEQSRVLGWWGRARVAGGAYLGRFAEDTGGGRSGASPSRRLDRRLAFLSGALALRASRGRWHLDYGGEVRLERGATEGHSWSRFDGEARVALGRDDRRLALTWERGSVQGAELPVDRFELGGIATSVPPSSVLATRILVPALPAGTLVGEEHEGQRAELGFLGGLLFYERHRLWEASRPRGSWLALAGFRWRFRLRSFPLLRLPGLAADVGVARILDEPFRDTTRWWAGLAWRP